MAPPLILASTSPYRATLLARLGLPFTSEAPGVDEAPRPGEPAGARALRLARAKAAAVAERCRDAWVIGSDQVAELDGLHLDKPGGAARCREQLAAQSGRTVRFHTAVVLRRHAPPTSEEHVDQTAVHFRTLGADEIARYVARDAPFDCAGSFRSEGLGAALFERLETQDPAALVGLPLIWLAGALRRAGLDPLAAQP
jgi:septum formation protein